MLTTPVPSETSGSIASTFDRLTDMPSGVIAGVGGRALCRQLRSSGIRTFVVGPREDGEASSDTLIEIGLNTLAAADLLEASTDCPDCRILYL